MLFQIEVQGTKNGMGVYAMHTVPAKTQASAEKKAIKQAGFINTHILKAILVRDYEESAPF